MAKVRDDWASKYAPSTLVGSTTESHGEYNDANSTMDICLKIQEQQSKPSEKFSKEPTYLSWILKN